MEELIKVQDQQEQRKKYGNKQSNKSEIALSKDSKIVDK